MIRVAVDDLAFVAVDAVFRAADDLLDPISQDASHLDHRGGPTLAAARRVQSELDVGAAVVTPGGELAAPFVVHLVLRSGPGAIDRNSVRRALVSAWQRASDWQLASVATSVIGAGAGQLDLEEAARLLAETYNQACRDAAYEGELTIVVRSDHERDVVEAAIGGSGS